MDPKDTAAILNAVADVVHLVRDAKAAVRSNDGLNSEVYLKFFRKIEKAFTQTSIEMKWAQFTTHLDPDTMARLEMVADLLSREIGEPIPAADDLSDLLARTNALIDVTIAASIPQQLKSAILDGLESIRNAIRSFRVRGMAGLVESLGRAASAAVIHESAFAAHRDEDVVKEYLEVLGRLNQIVATAYNLGTFILPAVQKLLSAGS